NPPPPRPVAPAEVQEVLLDSNPSGVEVTDGPRLLGVTPLKVRLTDKRPTLDVRLTKAGFDDLAYELSVNDVPALTLKMVVRKAVATSRHGDPRKTPAATPAPTTTPAQQPNKPPKVQTFDDVDNNNQVKVKTLED